MCGVVGFAGAALARELPDMVRSVAHRGPDDRGEWLSPDGSVGLGHSRLAIIDLDSRGRQPMIDRTRRLALAFNGEIYNYRALRADLVSSGFEFRTNTDTEVILNLWLRDRHKALGQLDGMFALAMWDGRTGRVTLARDPAGIKPMYFADLEPGIVFASELKALLQVQDVDRLIDPAAVLGHLTYLWSPGPKTMLQGIRKLDPGSWIDFDAGRVVACGEFRQGLPERIPVPGAPAALQESLRKAVSDQLVADVPVGAFLSGGLDSTTLVALAREELGSFDCFTVTTSTEAMRSEGFVDDLPYAEAAAKALGVRLHSARVGSEICDHIDYMLFHLDEPQADLAPLHVYAISRLAKSMGVSVLLSGAGGDDILAGYRRHAAIRFERLWDWLAPSLRSRIGETVSHLPINVALFRRLRKAVGNAGLSGDERTLSYFRWLEPSLAMGLLTPEFRESLVGEDRDIDFNAELARVPRHNSSLARALAIDERYFLVDHNLNYTDKMSMAAGVEVRVPFLSPQVLELAHRLSDEQLVKGAQTKWTLREAARGLVPDQIIDRPKAGFGVPLRSWMAGPLAPWLREQLSEDVLRRRGIFDPESVRGLLKANQAGSVDASYPLLAVAFVERWLQLFVDQVPRDDLISAPPELDWERVV